VSSGGYVNGSYFCAVGVMWLNAFLVSLCDVGRITTMMNCFLTYLMYYIKKYERWR